MKDACPLSFVAELARLAFALLGIDPGGTWAAARQSLQLLGFCCGTRSRV